MRRKWSLFFVLLFCLVGIGGCDFSFAGESTKPVQPQTSEIHLSYITIGVPDRDLQIVNEEINRLLMEKLGFTITYTKIDWENYPKQLSAMIASGSNFDIAFDTNYTQNAQNSAWLDLNGYLETVGEEMYEAVDPLFWEGATINGKIYGVPTNKELAVTKQWIFPTELVEKYNIDLGNYTTLKSLEPLLSMIKEKEPEYLPMEMNPDLCSGLFSLYGFEFVREKELPLVISSKSDKPEILNLFETPETQSLLILLREYYKKGYFNEDAALSVTPELLPGKKVFLSIASGGPHSETIWSRQRGYDVKSIPVTPPLVTTEDTRAAVMCINANTKYPLECIQFLNLLNTDPELRNLMNYGIEGIHYTLADNGQVIPSSEKRYEGVQYTQGNWFILKTKGGEVPDPIDKWEQYQDFNASVEKSKVLGFTPDMNGLSAEVTAVKAVFEKYYPGLITGTVDPYRFLPLFNRELEEAGINKIRIKLQEQLDAFLESQN